MYSDLPVPRDDVLTHPHEPQLTYRWYRDRKSGQVPFWLRIPLEQVSNRQGLHWSLNKIFELSPDRLCYPGRMSECTRICCTRMPQGLVPSMHIDGFIDPNPDINVGD